MYRCSICQSVAKPKEPRHLWPVVRETASYRTVAGQLVKTPFRQTEYELTVCRACHAELSRGEPLALVRERRGRPVPVPPPPKAPPLPHEVKRPPQVVTHKPTAGDGSVVTTPAAARIVWTSPEEFEVGRDASALPNEPPERSSRRTAPARRKDDKPKPRAAAKTKAAARGRGPKAGPRRKKQ